MDSIVTAERKRGYGPNALSIGTARGMPRRLASEKDLCPGPLERRLEFQ